MRIRPRLDDSYWYKTKEWQGRVNNMFWVYYILIAFNLIMNPTKESAIINSIAIIISIPAKLTYHKWEKKTFRKRYGLKEKEDEDTTT